MRGRSMMNQNQKDGFYLLVLVIILAICTIILKGNF